MFLSLEPYFFFQPLHLQKLKMYFKNKFWASLADILIAAAGVLWNTGSWKRQYWGAKEGAWSYDEAL